MTTGADTRQPSENRDRKTAAGADSRSPQLVVGIGASAGGLDAFTTFFTHMPTASGMAFVLVQHLDPSHKSMLVELLGRHTKMPIVEAIDGMRVDANHIFIIPPNATLTLRHGVLHVSKPAPAREHRRPIDSLFASLAEDRGERAVCVVLSGTGSDGTLGLRKIKEHGGLSLAQAQSDATAMSGMPQSAAAAGLIDHIIAVADMPALLMDYQRHLNSIAVEMEDQSNRADVAEHLATICRVLRSGTGHDFSQYKRNTLLRRIQRRMQVLRVDTVTDFIERLRQDPRQVELLFRELLIGVTHFFRDPDAFAALESAVIPKLLDHKQPGDQIRVWVPACATGEEVYSVAILIKEAMERQGLALKAQIFGTDVDDAAIAVARSARYHKKMEGVSSERVERWFSEDGEEYRPVREIREMCIFSSHSVVKDPPFSRLDLISCRNLLIYLEPALQDRVMQTFHYALRTGGFLYLGQSESITRKTKLFATIDKKHRIFERRESSVAASGFLLATPATPKTELEKTMAPRGSDAVDAEVRRVMEKHSPAYVVVDRQHEILRFSGGEVGRFLEPTPGTASLNLFAIVRKALRPAVRATLQRAHQTEAAVTSEHPLIDVDGEQRSIKIVVEPLADERGADGRRYVVAFQDLPVMAPGRRAEASPGRPRPDVLALEHELQTARTQLRATIDELETSNEEFKSANEEYQSVNEELQSSNEELETAKEEMQSVNEELQIVNGELNNKNEILTRLNSDLKNLLDSTQIATLFLDKELHITYFTPAMTELFHLRDSDHGRPITDLVTRINYSDLRNDVSKVLHTLVTIEREVQAVEDQTVFLMRMRPYRTVDNAIDGVVVTFLDVSARKRHEETSAHLAAIVESSQDAIISHGFDGSITSWNAGAEAIFGYTAAEAIGQPFSILIPPHQSDDVPDILQKIRSGERVAHFEIDRVRKDGKQIDVSLTHSPVRNSGGKIVATSTIAREFSERKLAENHRMLLISELDHRIKNMLAVIRSFISLTVKSAETPAQFAQIIGGRLNALSRVQDLLRLHQQGHAELKDLVAGELEAYGAGNEDRIRIEGAARICLTRRAAQTLSMAVHELCTNAAKYGALSVAEGRVEVRWFLTHSEDCPTLSLEWRESGGPTVSAPTRRGFGSDVIERVVEHDLHASVQRDFAAGGVRCAFHIPLSTDIGYEVTAE